MRLITILRICYSSYSFDDQRGTVEVIHLILGSAVLRGKKKILKFSFPALYPFIVHNFPPKVGIKTYRKCDGKVIFKLRTYIQKEFWSPLQNWPFKIFGVNSCCKAYLQFYRSFLYSDKTIRKLWLIGQDTKMWK